MSKSQPKKQSNRPAKTAKTPKSAGIANKKKAAKKPPAAKIFYWQEGRYGLMFASPAIALEVSAIHKAIKSSKTWGEFRKALPADVLRQFEIMNEFTDEADRPADADAFDRDEVPSYGDGDWPTWINQSMLDELPPEIIAEFGEVQDSTLNGPFLQLNTSIDVIARRLTSLGWTLEHRNDLKFEE